MVCLQISIFIVCTLNLARTHFEQEKKSFSFAGNLRKLLSLVKEYKTLYVEKFNRKYNYYSIISSFKTSKVNAKTIKERFEPGNSLLVIFSHSQVALRVCLCSHFMFDLHSRKYNQFLYFIIYVFLLKQVIIKNIFSLKLKNNNSNIFFNPCKKYYFK